MHEDKNNKNNQRIIFWILQIFKGLLKSHFLERWMSGLSRTPGKRVQGNTLTGVRIPLSPPTPSKQIKTNLKN